MLSCIQLEESAKVRLLQEWSEDNENNYAAIRKFAKNIAHRWLKETFSQEEFCSKGNEITRKELKSEFKKWDFFEFEYDIYEGALLYAYWLFFSGMALVYPTDTIKFTEKIKERFSGKEKTLSSLLFFKFLRFYAETKDISDENRKVNYYQTIKEINNCINESKEDTPILHTITDKQNVVVAAVKGKHEMMAYCIENDLTPNRIRKIILMSFPELQDKEVDLQKSALVSILNAGTAKFYLNEGMKEDCKKRLDEAKDGYSNNTLAIIQLTQLALENESKDNATIWERRKNMLRHI